MLRVVESIAVQGLGFRDEKRVADPSHQKLF